jgi:hypothetical protein
MGDMDITAILTALVATNTITVLITHIGTPLITVIIIRGGIIILIIIIIIGSNRG